MERLWSLLSRGAGLAGVLLFAATAFTPLVQLFQRPLAVPTGAGRADAIVVLGASVSPDGLLECSSLRRALTGILELRAGRAPLVLFLGPRHGQAVEADVRAGLAMRLGVPRRAILTEARGLTTRQEAERTAALLLPRGLKRVALVTNEHHLLRATALFRRAGLDIVPIAVRERPAAPSRPETRLAATRFLAGEVVARIAYRIFGLT